MSSRDPGRPNVLFILSDDQGAWALGAAGNDEIRTPHLDALAGRGSMFDRFYCASPVCSPARATLLTGRPPSHHGVHDYISGSHVGEGAVDFLAGQRTYLEDLAGEGYRLGLSGKWHLGASDAPRSGFVHWYAHQQGGGSYYGAPMVRNGRPVREPGYLTDLIADDARHFLERERERSEPFHLSVHFTAPHSPWAGSHPQRWTQLYDECEFRSCPQEPTHPWVPLVDGVPIGGEADTRAALQGYFAAVSAMDAAIGRVLSTLDGLGLRENTLVVFTSDNGFSCGQHGIWGKGNGTYPQNMYEEAVRVPLLGSQPGRLPQGRHVQQLLSAYDVAPTLLELCGVEGADLDGPGRSFVPELSGESSRRAEEVVVFDEYGPVRMIRTSDWKYVHRYPDGPHELYNLSTDPGERTNLVPDPVHGGRREEMLGRMDQWFQQNVRGRFDGLELPVTGAGQTSPVDSRDPRASFPAPPFPRSTRLGG